MKSSRNDWFYRRSAFPLRDAVPFELEKYWAARDSAPVVENTQWQPAGPLNYAGRVTALVRQRNTLFAGSAAGGVWRSTDLGRSWTSVWPIHLSQNIGALAFDPARPGRLLCATGEGNLTANTYPGCGIFASDDNGATWAPWVSRLLGTPMDAREDHHVPRRIAAIAVAKRREGGSLVAFGAVSKDESLPAGLFVERDSLASAPAHQRFITAWGHRSYNCHSVLFHPKRPRIVFAAIEPRGTRNGIWRSVDGGETWNPLRTGLPKGERCGRIELAISQSSPNVLFAVISDTGGSLRGVYRSQDGGDSWKRTSNAAFNGEDDLYSNAAIAIHPQDPALVVFGARRLYLSRDGGAHWQPLPTPGPVAAHHVILLSGPPARPEILSANDAGIAASFDGGLTWENRSRGIVATMFYNVAVAPTDSRVLGGGVQDIGALVTGPTLPPHTFTRAFKGDGGFLAFDPKNASAVYGTNTAARSFRHDAAAPLTSGWKSAALPFTTAEKKLRSLVLLSVRAAENGRPLQRWLASSRLWFSPGPRKRFRPASGYLDNSAISAIAFSPVDPDLIVAGTSDGGIFRYFQIDDAWSWTANLAGPDIPTRLITQLYFHPAERDTLILSVGSSNLPAANLKGDDSPFSHVFRSRDAGNTWEDIDRGALPNVVFNALAYEAHPPYRIFAGGDAGVWVFDETRWTNITGNLPNVIVSGLDYHAAARILTAATYGRGIWRLPVPEGTSFTPAKSGPSRTRPVAPKPPATTAKSTPSRTRPVAPKPPATPAQSAVSPTRTAAPKSAPSRKSAPNKRAAAKRQPKPAPANSATTARPRAGSPTKSPSGGKPATVAAKNRSRNPAPKKPGRRSPSKGTRG